MRIIIKNLTKSEIIASINEMLLSRNTIVGKTKAMSKNLEEILKENMIECRFPSLQFDKSTNVTDTAQLCILISGTTITHVRWLSRAEL